MQAQETYYHSYYSQPQAFVPMPVRHRKRRQHSFLWFIFIDVPFILIFGWLWIVWICIREIRRIR